MRSISTHLFLWQHNDLGEGLLRYVPNAGFSGDDSFTYTVIDAGGATDTVTVTVQPTQMVVTFSNSNSMYILDQGTIYSTVEVDLERTVVDVNAQVDITHWRDADLDGYLINPNGTRVELFTDVGGNGDNFEGTVLDDQTSTAITSGSAPFAGTYRPEGSLADFNGETGADIDM
jgi:hypothetical protein